MLTIKTVLVPVTTEIANSDAFSTAVNLARQFDAHLDALYVQPDALRAAGTSLIWAPGTAPLAATLVDTLDRAARDREANVKRAFEKACLRDSLPVLDTAPPEGARTPSVQWHARRGGEAELIIEHGLAADIIVVPRRLGNGRTGRAVLEPVLLGSGRPVLIPGTGTIPSPNGMRRVVIGWKPTRESARAVAAAMPFLLRAEEIVIVTVDEGNGEIDAGPLIRNLGWHGMQVRADYQKAKTLTPAETLLDAAARNGGLLVMGCYGRSRISEWAFGGFTKRALADAPLPVLMIH